MLESLGNPEPTKSPDLTALQEAISLRVGYCMMFRERYPANTSPEDCFSEESAYFLELEREYLNVPPFLQYPSIMGIVDHKCRPAISKAWDELVKQRHELEDTFKGLQRQWTNTPTLAIERFTPKGKVAKNIVDNYPLPIPKKYRDGILHTVTPGSPKLGKRSRLNNWQRDEKNARKSFYPNHRDYMVSLRLYYELLLETSKSGDKRAIPNNEPIRQHLKQRNFVARVINTAYQCIQIAKASHNEQPKGRLRKYEGIPYAMHTLRVTLAALLDTLPFIDWNNPKINPILLAAVGPMHDTVEDTTLSLKSTMKSLRDKVDSYDTSINPLITPQLASSDTATNHEDPAEDFKDQHLDLISNPQTLQDIAKILRILTDSIPGKEPQENKAPLDRAEITTAIRQNLFGETQTLLSLGLLTEKDLDLSLSALRAKIRGIQIKYGIRNLKEINPPCKTAMTFKDDHDNGKLTRFLIRANAIAQTPGTHKSSDPKTILQHALILKFEDRANNLITKPSDTEKQVISKRGDLRNAVERLISWAINDHDNIQFPLGNALPRLIHTCLKVYEDLASTHPHMIEALDREYIQKLEIWAKGEIEITRFQTSEKVTEVLDAYAKKHPEEDKTIHAFTTRPPNPSIP